MNEKLYCVFLAGNTVGRRREGTLMNNQGAIELTISDATQLVKLMESHESPNEALKDAYQKYKDAFGEPDGLEFMPIYKKPYDPTLWDNIKILADVKITRRVKRLVKRVGRHKVCKSGLTK